jgi:thymidylate kinase
MPLLVIEGPDGSGKSTLAQKLLKGTGHPTLLVKRSGSPGSIETLRFQQEWIKAQGQSGLNVIADRHPILSEAVYDRAVRDKGSFYIIQDAVNAFKLPRVMLIYCRTDMDQMFQNSQVEEQMEGVHDNYRKLVREYDQWIMALEEEHIDVYWFDYKTDEEQVVEEVKRFWEGKR